MNSAVKTASSPYLSSQEFLADKTSLADYSFETYQLMKDENISFETVLIQGSITLGCIKAKMLPNGLYENAELIPLNQR